MLFVDEVSMCSAWVLELVDVRLRVWRRDPRPCGGLALCVVGDLLQLSPVCRQPPPAPRQALYCFESPVWHALGLREVRLQHNHRQPAEAFAALCRTLRQGARLDAEARRLLAQRQRDVAPLDAVRVMVRRQAVHAHNTRRLQALPAASVRLAFPQALAGSCAELRQALARDVREGLYLPDGQQHQEFKTGARVMLIVNCRTDGGAAYVNGDRGTVLGFTCARPEPSVVAAPSLVAQAPGVALADQGEAPVVRFDRTGQGVAVHPYAFRRQLPAPVDGAPAAHAELRAWPLCLAWASTVHKVQGATVSGALHVEDRLLATFYVSRATQLAGCA